ncbi:LOW QUALITY PROTEIN: spermatogenesis-associated protein 31D1-like [Hipposideros larvatus]
MAESAAGQHDLVVALLLWSSKGKPMELQFYQQPSHPKAGEDYLLENDTQLFWGFPSLPSKSLPSAVCVLGDYSSIFIFNRILNASTCQEHPVLFHPLSPPLPEVQPQPSPEILPQAHLLSPFPTLPSAPMPQIRRYRGHFHQPQNESDTITSSEKQQLKWHVLRKQQEHLWGLPSVVQRSQQDFCSSAPTQAKVSVFNPSGEFTLSNELHKKLEHHLQKRLIQHRWGLPCRIHESLSLLRSPSDSSETSELESNYGLSWTCAYKGQSSKNLNVGLSQPRSFYERGSEMLQLEEDEEKGEGNSPENGQKDHILSDSESSSDKDLVYDSEEDLDGHRESLSGENAMVSGQSLHQRQLENVLKVHSSNKFEEIKAGRLPGPVHNSWHAIKQTSTLSVKSHTLIKQRSLPLSGGADCCLNTCQELSWVHKRSKIPAVQDPKSSGSKEQLPRELQSEIDNRERSQAQDQRSDLSAASDSFAYKASQTRAQGVPTVDMGASQVLHVQGEDRGVGTQQQQAPWLPEHVLRCGQDKNFPPGIKAVSHQGFKSQSLGGGDPGFGTSQPGRRNVPTQDMSFENTLGSKSSQTLSQEGPSPPERPFRMKVKHFFQWLHPLRICKKKENSWGKGGPISAVGNRGPDESRAAWSGLTEAQKVTTGLGKFLQEKLGRWHATDIPCPKEPLPAPGKLGKQQEAQVRAQAGPIQQPASSSRAPCCKVTKSCQQAAGFADQSSTNMRQIRDKDRQHQKIVAFKEQLSCQEHSQSRPQREAVPHPSPTLRCQAEQGPQAALTTAGGTAFGDESLLFRHKTFTRIFRENIFPPSNKSFLWRILILPNKCFSNNNAVFSVYCVGGMGFG